MHAAIKQPVLAFPVQPLPRRNSRTTAKNEAGNPILLTTFQHYV